MSDRPHLKESFGRRTNTLGSQAPQLPASTCSILSPEAQTAGAEKHEKEGLGFKNGVTAAVDRKNSCD